MKKDDLCVFFHAAACEDNQEILQSLANSTFAASPSAIAISETNPVKALDIIERKSEGRPAVLVTLCGKMMKAASGSDISLLTLGLPANFGRKHYIAASSDSIGDMLREIKRCVQ